MKSFTCAFLVFSAVTLMGQLAPVEAHSWADCIDWRPKDPSNPKWGDDDGECHGYARRYPLGKAFGSLDDDPGRHYRQVADPKKAVPCSNKKDGIEKGMDETRADPPEDAYGGSKRGEMTMTNVGKTLCVRWPAKNHAESNEDDTVVQINISKSQGEDPSQLQLLENTIAKLRYKNCDKGKPDTRPCGGCFQVPVRASGIYLLQWRWMLNEDIKIGNA
ncbi:hypothetical protein BGZ94_002746 [Podila epigama]|nr:hypothetical protein BGZ94_002746 [Podila epigama]